MNMEKDNGIEVYRVISKDRENVKGRYNRFHIVFKKSTIQPNCTFFKKMKRK